jgi:prevent-host-death family protein
VTITVGVHEAKTTLSELLRKVEAGEDVVIARGGTPIARLTAERPATRRSFGQDVGAFTVPTDFDEPLADENAWYE